MIDFADIIMRRLWLYDRDGVNNAWSNSYIVIVRVEEHVLEQTNVYAV